MAGSLLIPEAASWLGGFQTEGPGVSPRPHDDQIDSLSQLLGGLHTREIPIQRSVEWAMNAFVSMRSGAGSWLARENWRSAPGKLKANGDQLAGG